MGPGCGHRFAVPAGRVAKRSGTYVQTAVSKASQVPAPRDTPAQVATSRAPRGPPVSSLLLMHRTARAP